MAFSFDVMSLSFSSSDGVGHSLVLDGLARCSTYESIVQCLSADTGLLSEVETVSFEIR